MILRPAGQHEGPMAVGQLGLIFFREALERVTNLVVGHGAGDASAAIDLLFQFFPVHGLPVAREMENLFSNVAQATLVPKNG